MNTFLKNLTIAFATALALAVVASAQVNVVRFEVDLREYIDAGQFDPTTDSVGIRGDTVPLSWSTSIDMELIEQTGRYVALVSFEKPEGERVLYKFKIRDLAEANNGWEEGRNREVILQADTVYVSRPFNEPPPPLEKTFSGDVREHLDFPSDFLARRNLYVYLPPDYETNISRRYPVLYMHDGRNVFDRSEAGDEWRMDEVAQQLIQSGQIEPVIIVGVGNTPERTYEYTPTRVTDRMDLHFVGIQEIAPEKNLSKIVGTYTFGDSGKMVVATDSNGLYLTVHGEETRHAIIEMEDGSFHVPTLRASMTFNFDDSRKVTGGEVVSMNQRSSGGAQLYGRMLIEEIKPFIDATYRTISSREGTSVGGSSFGGLLTMYLGTHYPEMFSGLLVVSPSVWWDDMVILRMVRDAGYHDQRIWLDMGLAEGADMVGGARELFSTLREYGWTDGKNLIFVEEPDATHSEKAWARRVPHMLRFLYRK